MFCTDCGKEISDKAIACPHCGCATRVSIGNDSGNPGYIFLGCCIPIAGLILWLVWKNEKPKNAKQCLIGFLINIGIVIAYYLFWLLFFATVVSSV